MLRKSLSLLLLLVLLAGTSLTAQTRFEIKPTLQYGLGQTNYVLEAKSQAESGTLEVRSRLEFPLDVPFVGVEASLHLGVPGQRRWSFAGGIYAAISDPGAVMVDHDWSRVGDEPFRKFSYTESDVEISATYWYLEVDYWLFRKFGAEMALTAGFRHQHIKQDIIGYYGWQYDDEGNRFDVRGDERGIFYKITYYLPSLGLRSQWRTSPTSTLDLRISYVQVFSTDYDDHLLRYKIGTADGVGLGGELQADWRLQLGGENLTGPFLDFSLTLLYLGAWGDQTQEWYGNDPASPDFDDTGSVVSGITHDITSFQANVGVKLGLAF